MDRSQECSSRQNATSSIRSRKCETVSASASVFPSVAVHRLIRFGQRRGFFLTELLIGLLFPCLVIVLCLAAIAVLAVPLGGWDKADDSFGPMAAPEKKPSCHSPPHSAGWSIDGRILVASAPYQDVVVMDPLSGYHIATFPQHGTLAGRVDITADGSMIAMFFTDGSFWVSQGPLSQGQSVKIGQVDNVTDRLRGSVSADGELIAWAHTAGEIEVYRQQSDGAALPFAHAITLPLAGAELFDARLSSNHAFLAVSTTHGELIVWDMDETLQTGRGVEHFRMELSPHKYTGLAFSPDATLLAAGDSTGELSVVDLAGKEVAEQMTLDTRHFHALSFSPDNNLILVGGHDSCVAVCDWQTGLVTEELVGHESDVTSVHVSHNGRTLYSASWDGSCRVWLLAGATALARHAIWPDNSFGMTGLRDNVAAVDLLDGPSLPALEPAAGIGKPE